jgi:hypothetical protein
VSVEVKAPDLGAAYYLNGFPKSGLHLLAAMMLPVAKPLMDQDGPFDKPWAGSFQDNSWTANWAKMEPLAYKLGRMTAGTFLKGHTGHNETIERYLYLLGAAHIFIYRDLRDVAVSQTFHILNSEDERFAHPDRELYADLGDFGDSLMAVIEGIGKYPGVLARWELYAPWLDVAWVHKIRFEDAVRDTEGVAERVLVYGLERVAQVFQKRPVVNREVFDLLVRQMADAARARKYSPTYRRGEPGEWREHFTEQHIEAFVRTDANGWLEKLGYEEGDW